MSLTDRELLELAAKAAGYVVRWYEDSLAYGPTFGIEVEPGNPSGFEPWSPLENDGDALRLLCKLKLSLNSNSATVGVGGYTPGWDHVFAQEQIIDGDAQSAHRRAIVRAAAEIGKAMQEKH